MALNLLKRSEKGSALSAADHDANCTATENAVDPLQLHDGAVVYAEDFGANPNGTTNCSTAINSAISAASTYDRGGPAARRGRAAAQGHLSDRADGPAALAVRAERHIADGDDLVGAV